MGNPNLLHIKHHFIHGYKSVTYYEIRHFLGLGFDESDTLGTYVHEKPIPKFM